MLNDFIRIFSGNLHQYGKQGLRVPKVPQSANFVQIRRVVAGLCHFCRMILPVQPAKVVLNRGRESSVQRRHPWIFSGAIARIEGQTADGDWVQVVNQAGETLAWGHYQKGSISIRILEFGPSTDEEIYVRRLRNALALRESTGVLPPETDCFRLIHGEGDGLPGLVIDVYASVAVIQAHSAGMTRDASAIASALEKVLGKRIDGIYFRSTSSESGQWLLGERSDAVRVRECGNWFEVDVARGQKTGFFLDQRENRQIFGRYAAGRKVLNTFCYSGGFSIYALQQGASLVHSVDASASAIELCRRNLSINGFDPEQHACFAADTFQFLQNSETDYDVIVLDPPAFAKHKDARHQAMKGYQRLNTEAMKHIRSGGILFTFSCSQVVDRQLFYDTVMSAAIASGRNARVLAHLSQPADHPVSAFHPEGAYLKGLILHID